MPIFLHNVMGCYLFISDNINGRERIKKNEEREIGESDRPRRKIGRPPGD